MAEGSVLTLALGTGLVSAVAVSALSHWSAARRELKQREHDLVVRREQMAHDVTLRQRERAYDRSVNAYLAVLEYLEMAVDALGTTESGATWVYVGTPDEAASPVTDVVRETERAAPFDLGQMRRGAQAFGSVAVLALLNDFQALLGTARAIKGEYFAALSAGAPPDHVKLLRSQFVDARRAVVVGVDHVGAQINGELRGVDEPPRITLSS